ncbi:MAG: DUF3488 domain-containing protein [Acidobacteria bacterium]|nr:DUF3488 domain-containing protein [Acidobacteriota bacterium]
MPGPARYFEWSLLGMLASSSVAVALSGFVELPLLAVAAAILLRAARLAGLVRWTLPDALFNALAILLIGFWALDYSQISRDFLEATLRLVAFLAAAMIIRARNRRDFLLLKLVALMQLIAASVLSVSLALLVLFLLFAGFGLAAQLSGEIRSSLESTPQLARTPVAGTGRRLTLLTAGVMAAILAIGMGFFIVLPRTATAALNTLSRAGVRLPGFSDEIRLGQIGRIRMMAAPVMHVRFDGASRREGLKWRGSALSRFDGKRWFNPPEQGERLMVDQGNLQPAPPEQLWIPGERISYEVQLKSVTSDVLFFAGLPEALGIPARTVIRTPVGGYELPRGLARGLRYQVFRAFLPDERRPVRRPGLALTLAERERYTELPELVDPRVRDLAALIAGQGMSRYGKARAIEEYLRNTYGYSIEPLSAEPEDPLARFLFESKSGHCEYFASAMAVMLRSLGIPARIATGFLGGTYNPVSGWYLIRSSDAHSWVEVFFDGFGWLAFDPTPPDPNAASLLSWSRLSLYLDAADVFWQEWVVNYDMQHQLSIVERIGRLVGRGSGWNLTWPRGRAPWSGVDGRSAAGAVGVLAFAAGLAWAARILWRHRRRKAETDKLRQGQGSASDAAILYQRMLEILERRGVVKPAWMTADEFARCVPEGDKAAVQRFTGDYLAFRFGGEGQRAGRMLAVLEEMEGAERRV